MTFGEIFQELNRLREMVNDTEDAIKALRDNVDLDTQKALNEAIRPLGAARDALWKADRAVEAERDSKRGK